MMAIEDALEREIDSIEKRYAQGYLTREQANKEIRDCERDARDAWECERDEAHRQVDRDFGYGY